jgi:hypothetical protein
MADQRPGPTALLQAETDASALGGAPAASSPGALVEQLLIHTEGAVTPSTHQQAVDASAKSLSPGLHIGSLVSVTGRSAIVALDGREHEAALAEHVEVEFLRAALDAAEPVLLQSVRGPGLTIMGVLQGLQGRFPSRLVGDRVLVTGESEVVVRSGKSALRLREDGVVDLIGARISASSRGLLRLVGRALRLN